MGYLKGTEVYHLKDISHRAQLKGTLGLYPLTTINSGSQFPPNISLLTIIAFVCREYSNG